MKIQRRIFDRVLVLEPACRTDLRGRTAFFAPGELQAVVPGLTVREQRVYTMPEANTFFGIHYQDRPYPQAKIISVVHGSGLDYVVDLRKESPTYRRWERLTLRAGEPLAVYIPAGFGHAFLSLEKDTVQLFAADAPFGNAGSIHYRDPEIGLELPCGDPILSEMDRQAPFLRDLDLSW